jgi:LmbE family N-acetylglucosaminyl deacetylase
LETRGAGDLSRNLLRSLTTQNFPRFTGPAFPLVEYIATNVRRLNPLLLLPLALALVSAPSGPLKAQRVFAGEVELRQALERLNTLGSAMMIGAHPDDEREAVLAYLALGRHVRAAYLSLTRGEGGQNLIGSEQGDELGVLRTQELLSSRRIDGAEQYFTRAIDFGFSKTAAETLEKWPREKVLADVVWNIRRFRPDVVLLVFSGTPRDGHGHHQVSSILGREAYTAAADPSRFPEQLAYVQPWQAKRLMMNAGGGPGGPGGPNQQKEQKEQKEEKQDPDRLDLDVGIYSPELGASYGEIGGASRSANRSQGTGAAERKGSQKNPLLTVAGPKATKDIFEGIDITWNRLPGGAEIGALLKQALDSYVPAHPEALLPQLARVRPLVAAMTGPGKDPWAERKLKELDEAMVLASGLWLEAQASFASVGDRYAVSPGGSLRVTMQALVRNPVQVTLQGIRVTGIDGIPPLNIASTVLVNNQPSQFPTTIKIPENQPATQPYWLQQPKDGPLYSIPDPRLLGNAENAPALEAHFNVRLAGTDLEIVRPVHFRYTDRVYGELVRPLVIAPPAAIGLSSDALVFATAASRKIEVPIRATTAKIAGDLHLEVPNGWKVEPASRHFEIAMPGDRASLAFEITPPQAEARGKLRAVAQLGAQRITTGSVVIDYPHIAAQTLFPPAELSLVRSEIKILSKKIAYLMGTGDEVPAALEQLGCEVTILTPADLMRGDLSRFDAIVTGVRAFEAHPEEFVPAAPRLQEYASNGGTVIMQYNQVQATGLDVPIGPYPFHLSRERVTVEDAPVTFPNPQLPLLQSPNRITAEDFAGWVQERGNYFADKWDPRYTPVVETHDPGEEPLQGGMLYAKVGKGAFIYSSFAWFRQLPAGVPGAYRVFANMLSAAKTQ